MKLLIETLQEDIKANFGNKKIFHLLKNKKFKLILYFRIANFFYKKNQTKRTYIARFLQSIFTKYFYKDV